MHEAPQQHLRIHFRPVVFAFLAATTRCAATPSTDVGTEVDDSQCPAAVGTRELHQFVENYAQTLEVSNRRSGSADLRLSLQAARSDSQVQ